MEHSYPPKITALIWIKINLTLHNAQCLLETNSSWVQLSSLLTLVKHSSWRQFNTLPLHLIDFTPSASKHKTHNGLNIILVCKTDSLRKIVAGRFIFTIGLKWTGEVSQGMVNRIFNSNKCEVFDFDQLNRGRTYTINDMVLKNIVKQRNLEFQEHRHKMLE